MHGSSPASDEDHSFVASNFGVIYLAAIVAVPFYIVSVIVGLNMGMTTLLLVMFAAVALMVHRWRCKRRPSVARGGIGSITLSGGLGAVAVFLLIQAIPYGRLHRNGDVVTEPNWPDDDTTALVVRACYDCHSNQTVYPWYSHIAPISWLVSDHVGEARSKVNFSDLGSGSADTNEVIDVIRQDVMPPFFYTPFGLHPDAQLTTEERQRLIDGLSKMPEFRPRAKTDAAGQVVKGSGRLKGGTVSGGIVNGSKATMDAK